jgi:hypothetical protein
MTYVLGSACAEVLVRVGLSRDEVVGALMREIGLSYPDAERAWWTTRPSYRVGDDRVLVAVH